MNLLQLDHVVLTGHLLPLLQLNDLLRLRRMCKSSKIIAEDFTRTQKIQTRRQLQIKNEIEDVNPYEQFNNMENSLGVLPVTNDMYFSYLDLQLQSPHLQNLLETYAANVTHLTLHSFQVPLHSVEMLQFLKSFPKVKHLELELKYGFGDNDPLTEQVEESLENELMVLFKNLTRIKFRISDEGFEASESQVQDTFTFIVRLVESCIPNLEQLDLPFRRIIDEYDDVMNEKCINLACKCLFNAPKLKLEHVDGVFIDGLLTTDDPRPPEMGTIQAMTKRINEKVSCLVSPLQSSFRLELPNLEKIIFKPPSPYDWDTPFRGPQEHVTTHWPNLKKIKVFFTKQMRAWRLKIPQLWDFLLAGIKRETVVKLEIRFWGFERPNDTFPRSIDITTSLPNLKILKIRAYAKMLINLPELWSGLPFLEELTFHSCDNLGNDDFMGTDASSPAFFNLKHLKALTLERMEAMQVTDEIFSQVLCHMPLKKLFLSSRVPLSNMITLEGVRSLLTGIFASTIEKFPLGQLNLRNVSNEDKKETENLFRSSKMM